MKPERFAKFSREDLIRFNIRKDEQIEFYEKKFIKQEKIGYIFVEGKKYNVIFEREE